MTRRLDLSDEDGRVAVSLGIGSGIGAIFGAPLGGAVLAASIVYREDFDYRSLIPGFITSGTAYAIYGSILGFEPLFGFIAPDYDFDPRQLIWFLVIGIVSAAIGYLYARTFYAPSIDSPTAGRLCAQAGDRRALVGLLALVIPQILSSGYGWAQKAAAIDTLMAIPLWIVLILPSPRSSRRRCRSAPAARADLRAGHRDRRVRRRRDLAAGAIWPAHPEFPRPRGFRRRGDDGVLRQRRPCPAGRDDHGRRDDRLVLGRAGRDDRRRDRLSAHHPNRRVDLSGAATQPRNRRAERRALAPAD